MEGILFEDQLSSRDPEQVYYTRNQMPSCRVDDLIMISNSQGSYLFANYNRDRDESPVFKIRNSRADYGQLQLQLVVMEVIYPIPLFHHESERANILHAVRDGLAVVRETDNIITFSVGRMHRIEEVDLKTIDCVQPIRVKSPIRVEGDCENGISGEVKVERGPRVPYQYFLSMRPRYGSVQLNNRTGNWQYEGRCDEVENDVFEITVWDGLGGYATQRIYIKCEEEESPSDVNIVNLPLPMVAAAPLPIFGDVRVINTPNVSISGIPTVNLASGTITVNIGPAIEISGIVSVTLNNPVQVTGVVDLGPTAAVAISGVPTVILDAASAISLSVAEPLEVTGVVDLGPTAVVAISGVPTVILDAASAISLSVAEPLEVTGVVDLGPTAAVAISGVPTVILDAASAISLSVAEPLEVTGVVDLGPSAAVAISGVPTVILDAASAISLSVAEPLEVTGVVDLGPTAAVAISGVPTVILDAASAISLSVAEPLEVTGVVDLGPTAAVAISGVPTVILDAASAISLSVAEPLEVTGAVDLGPTAAVAISGVPVISISGVDTSTGFVPVTGLLEFGSAAVAISGVPTVAVGSTVSVTIAEPVNFNLANRSTVNLSGLVAFVPGVTSYFPETGGIDVSDLIDYSYFIGWLEPAPVGTVVVQSQIAPVVNSIFGDLFVPGASPTVLTTGGLDVITDNRYLQFSRLAIFDATVGSTVLVYFQGLR